MEFEADRMTGLKLTDEVVLPERDVILEEQNHARANNPRARLGEQIDAALYLNSPYGKPVIGWRHEMERLTRDDAIGFYRRFYGPNDAVVVVAGDVEPEAGAQARRGHLRQSWRANKNIVAAPAAAGAAAGGGALAHARRPARRAADAAARLSGAVVPHRQARPIGGAGGARAYPRLRQNSRLYRALVVDKHVAVAAGAWYDSSALDMSKFGVYGAPRRASRLPQLEAAIDAVIAEVIAKGIGADELARAKTRLIADAVYAQDNQASWRAGTARR